MAAMCCAIVGFHSTHRQISHWAMPYPHPHQPLPRRGFASDIRCGFAEVICSGTPLHKSNIQHLICRWICLDMLITRSRILYSLEPFNRSYQWSFKDWQRYRSLAFVSPWYLVILKSGLPNRPSLIVSSKVDLSETGYSHMAFFPWEVGCVKPWLFGLFPFHSSDKSASDNSTMKSWAILPDLDWWFPHWSIHHDWKS